MDNGKESTYDEAVWKGSSWSTKLRNCRLLLLLLLNFLLSHIALDDWQQLHNGEPNLGNEYVFAGFQEVFVKKKGGGSCSKKKPFTHSMHASFCCRYVALFGWVCLYSFVSFFYFFISFFYYCNPYVI